MCIASPCRAGCSSLLVECGWASWIRTIGKAMMMMLMILKYCTVVDDDGTLTKEQTRCTHTPGKACAWGFAAYCGTCCKLLLPPYTQQSDRDQHNAGRTGCRLGGLQAVAGRTGQDRYD